MHDCSKSVVTVANPRPKDAPATTVTTATPETSATPPVSNASSASSVPEKDDVRYPDFAVMMSTGSLESVHSIWELKAPPLLYTVRKEGVVVSDSYKRSIRSVFTDPTHVGQIIQQAQCAFDEYKHQSHMYVFLVAGYWVKPFIMSRDNMPSKDFNYKDATYDDLVKFVTTWPKKMFQLLNSKKNDYSNEFKEYWSKAIASVEEDLENLVE